MVQPISVLACVHSAVKSGRVRVGHSRRGINLAMSFNKPRSWQQRHAAVFWCTVGPSASCCLIYDTAVCARPNSSKPRGACRIERDAVVGLSSHLEFEPSKQQPGANHRQRPARAWPSFVLRRSPESPAIFYAFEMFKRIPMKMNPV